jgi:Flp pilus assembly pilin Flp
MSRRSRKVVSPLVVTSPGQTMAEYAMILATIAVVAAALVQNAGAIVDALVNHVCTLF